MNEGMKNFAIIVLESAVFGLLYSFPFEAPYYWLAFVALYIGVGIVHGIIFRGNIAKGVGAAVAAGALSGVWVTIFNLQNVSPGESVFFWFLIGVFVNGLMYSLRPSVLLFYLIVFVTMTVQTQYTKKQEQKSNTVKI